MKRSILALVATALLAAACGSDAGNGLGQDTSSEAVTSAGFDPTDDRPDFCLVLDETYERLNENTDAAGSSGGDQLLLFASNLSEYNRMIARLDDVAPDEIKADMSVVRDTWDEQFDEVGATPSELPAATIRILLSGVLSASSFRAVDDWATLNCGTQLFSYTPPTCAAIPEGTRQALNSLPTVGLNAQTAWSALRDLGQALPSVAESTSLVVQSGEMLQPPPLSWRESVVRSAQADPAVLENLSTISLELEATCGTGLPGASELPGLIPLASEWEVSRINPLWMECGLLGLTDDWVGIYDCAGLVTTYSFGSQAVARIETELVASQYYPYGNWLVALSAQTIPAQGLDPETEIQQLHLVDLKAGVETIFETYRSDEEGAPLWYSAQSQGSSAVVPLETASELFVFDSGGRVAALPEEFDGRVYGRAGWLPGNSILVTPGSSKPSLRFDPTAGQFASAAGSVGLGGSNDLICPGLFAADGEIWDYSGLEATAVAVPGLRGVPLTPSVAVDTGEIAAYGPQGLLWEINRRQIVDSSVIIGQWLVIRNQSGQTVVVDPQTGAEASPHPVVPWLAEEFRWFAPEGGSELPDIFKAYYFDTNAGLFYAVAGDSTIIVPTSEICA